MTFTQAVDREDTFQRAKMEAAARKMLLTIRALSETGSVGAAEAYLQASREYEESK